MKLKGQIVLVTGAAKRIGREIALNLALDGAVLVLHYRKSVREAKALQKKINGMGTQAFLVQEDFLVKKGERIETKVTGFIRKIERKVPRVDALVNNASEFFPTPINSLKSKDWNLLMDSNLTFPIFLAKELGLKMKKRKKGKIINFTDTHLSRPSSEHLAYFIAKAGLKTGSEVLAKALAPHVQVNLIAPGPILPPAGASAKHREAAGERTLQNRYGTPEDIVRAVRYLMEADYITGQSMVVDGGASIK